MRAGVLSWLDEELLELVVGVGVDVGVSVGVVDEGANVKGAVANGGADSKAVAPAGRLVSDRRASLGAANVAANEVPEGEPCRRKC
jgi:hypothetical protein